MATPFSALCHIKGLKLPTAPEGGANGPVGFKTDRPIPPRQPEQYEYDSAYDPICTDETTPSAVTGGKKDEAVGAVLSYSGHSTHCLTRLNPYPPAKK